MKIENQNLSLNSSQLIDTSNFSDETKNPQENYEEKRKIRNFSFINKIANKKELESILSWTFREYGIQKACLLADLLKEIGFKYATKGGISISIEDLKVPRLKNQLLFETNSKLHKIEIKYKRGEITDAEWFQKRIASWNVTSELIKSEIINYFEKTDPLNPVYMMAFSGARGNLSQVRQLIGMRGLMSDQKGEIIGLPIQKNFREGLRITDFIISSYGARKGLVDTAIRTADSGYLTRRLIDIAQDVIIRQFDCRTKTGISLYRYHKNPKFKIAFSDRILGRILTKPVIDLQTKKKLASANQEVDFDLANLIDSFKIDKVSVRSPLTCESSRSICQKCYGWDLAQAKLIKIGEAVGIIAAQSIGEPGTQLTMRTFHTGGIFTSELGQEIYTKMSGQINFSPLLKSHFIRTIDGDYAQVVEKASFIEVINYKNEKIRINIARDSVLFIKNKDFVKANQVIGQVPLALKKESEEQIEKEIYSKFSGEIYFQFKKNYNFFEYNTIIWVLSSKIYKLPFEAKSNIKLFTTKQNKQSLGKTKFVSKSRNNLQKVDIISRKNLHLIEDFEFFQESHIYYNINNTTQVTENITYLLIDKNQNKIALNPLLDDNLNIKGNLLIGDLLTTACSTKTGGLIYNLNIHFSSNKVNHYQEILNGGILLWIPEEVYPLNRDVAVLLAENGSIVSSGMEIAKNVFCKNNGILFVKEKTKIVHDITIKIGQIYSFHKKTLNFKAFLNNFESKFFFPGEEILPNIILQNLVFTEVFIFNDIVELILRPVFQYNVSKPKKYKPKKSKQQILNKKDNLGGQIFYRKFLLVKDHDRIGANSSLNLIKSQVYFSLEKAHFQRNSRIIAEFSFGADDLKKSSLIIKKVENFSLLNQIPTQIQKQELTQSLLVKKGQLIEPFTVVSSFHISDEKFEKIYKAESKFSKYQELAILSENDVTEFYLDEKDSTITKNEFLFEEDLLAEGIKTRQAGKIFYKDGSIIKLQHAKPYLFSEGAIIQRNHGDFILKDESLGLLIFKILKTEDIVQGLPKIEEILEARVPKQSALLIENPGFISNLIFKADTKILRFNILMLSENGNIKKINEIPYLFENIESSNLNNFQQISLGQPVNDGVINSHDILTNYFYYYQKRDALHKATLRSLNKVASLLIESIQSIYYSQGIRISDKHIEVILRQMMSRVEIEEPGDTPFLPGEFINLKQIKIINEMLMERNKKMVYYKPVILGLTKASLNTESFISAASFQETRRVLTQAAVEGKIDWLRGLKENVIIGRLIPAGTGFTTTTDLSKRLLSSKLHTKK